MEKKILLIVRASTEKQETESQKNELVQYCEGLGFVKEEMEIIEVAGASAVKLNNKYNQMLENIKATILNNPTIKSVALWHINRLGRVESKLQEMKEFFVQNKIQLYSKENNLSLLNPDGTVNDSANIVFAVYASLIKCETNEMFAKMKRGRMRNKEKGIYNGGKIMYGYKLDATKHFIINEEEAEIVRLIFNEYATGKYSIYKLVEELNSRGVTKDGKKLTFDIVRNCLANKSYYNGNQPLITEELFNKCDKVKVDSAVQQRTKESKNINYAVGLLKCECGHNYIVSGTVYTCFSKPKARRHREVSTCASPTINREILDNLLWYVTKQLHIKYINTKDSENIENVKKEISILNTKLSTCEREIEKLKASKKANEQNYIDDKINVDILIAKNKSLDSKIGIEQVKKDNYLNEIKEKENQITSLLEPEKDVFIKTLFAQHYTNEDREKIKGWMFQHIKEVRLERAGEGKYKKCIIKIYSKSGLEFDFLYDIYINSFKKEECCIFYEGLPLDDKDNEMVLDDGRDTAKKRIYKKIGLPILQIPDMFFISETLHKDKDYWAKFQELINKNPNLN